MGEARIVRVATEPGDLHTLPPGTVLVAADGTALRRVDPPICERTGGPFWFDECPGCDDWVTEGPESVGYGADQLFAEEGDRILARAACWWERPDLYGPYHPHFTKPHIPGPYLIAHVPQRGRSTTTGEVV